MALSASVPEEQKLYARWLDVGSRTGFAALCAAFAVYVSGLLPPYVALETLPSLWGLPVAQYLKATGAPEGWGWAALLARSDYLNLAAIVWLALVSALCYARVLAALLARREWLQSAIAVAQLLAFAAVLAGLC